MHSDVVKTQNVFGSHGGFLTDAMNNQIKLTHYDNRKKRTHDSNQHVQLSGRVRCPIIWTFPYFMSTFSKVGVGFDKTVQMQKPDHLLAYKIEMV